MRDNFVFKCQSNKIQLLKVIYMWFYLRMTSLFELLEVHVFK